MMLALEDLKKSREVSVRLKMLLLVQDIKPFIISRWQDSSIFVV